VAANKLFLALPFVLAMGSASVSAQNTADFMNTMTVCGMGSSITIDSSMEKSLQELYSGSGAKGKLSQQIVTEMKDIIMKNPNNSSEFVDEYMKCVTQLLPKSNNK
jgi:hypothetical protein